MEGRYLERSHDVEVADKPFEFFMNRFRLLEAAPRGVYAVHRLAGVGDTPTD
jgi:oxygen-independent coproporphyrinogen-3 oxidase